MAHADPLSTTGSDAVGSPSTIPDTQATAAGTHRLATRVVRRPRDFYQTLSGNLTVSTLGIGTYLGECNDAEDALYEASVREALGSGINLIDTAINYRCQRSERCVGKVLAALIESGSIRRDEVIVCTKGGYIALDGAPPATREQYDSYVQRTFYDAGIVARHEVARGGHSIAPAFLAHQLSLSRGNLGVGTIDLYYLHNPEEQLASVDRPTFMTRMRAAFEWLEGRAAAGEITGYGCATWSGLRVTPDQRQHLSLSDLVTLAREVGGTSHHFRAVMAPFSLAATEALRLPTQSLGRKVVPLVEAVDALGVALIASAPLMQGALASGLPPQLHELFPACVTDAQRALRFASSIPGITAVLTGMRRDDHVTENVAAWNDLLPHSG